MNHLSCQKCGQKPYYEFAVSTRSKRGFAVKCRDCTPKKRTIPREPIRPDNERAKAIALYYIENPKASAKEVAVATGIPERTIYYYQHANSYLKALRTLASKKVTNFIPRALSGLGESLDSNNADVKYKSAVKVLENEKVLIKDGTEIIVNNLTNLPVATLKEIAAQAKDIPEQTILEAELI